MSDSSSKRAEVISSPNFAINVMMQPKSLHQSTTSSNEKEHESTLLANSFEDGSIDPSEISLPNAPSQVIDDSKKVVD